MTWFSSPEQQAPFGQQSLTEIATRVARIFGHNGLRVEVHDGQGWATLRDANGITLLADPSMLVPKSMIDVDGECVDQASIPSQYPMYGICHELGHIEDYLDPVSSYDTLKKRSSSEHFFWNILDDGVINNRLRRVPVLNTLTDEIYENTLFPKSDLRQKPKHVQLMYGYLLRQVTPQRSIVLSDDVGELLKGLERFEDTNGDVINVYAELIKRETTLVERRRLAEASILPLYNQLKEEDRQQKQDSDKNSGSDTSDGDATDQNESDNDTGSSSGNSVEDGWENDYAAYEQSAGCSHGDHEDTTPDSYDSNAEDEGSSEASQAGEQMRDAMREAAKQISEQRQNENDSDNPNNTQSPSKDAVAEAAGSIQGELGISFDKAYLYAESIQRLRGAIHEVAEALQQLTVPAVEYSSPRYRRRPSAWGSTLSPRDLFKVVIAQQTEDQQPVVWKPTEIKTRREGYSFNGLDIHLLVDVSGSMHGAKAEAAADCYVLLAEGIDLARKLAADRNPLAPKPDVRQQTIAFGSAAEVLSPIAHTAVAQDKGAAFSTLLDANSGATYVADAIQSAAQVGAKYPERTQLVYIISDGSFSDSSDATNALRALGPNAFAAQFVIQSLGTRPITPSSAHVQDVLELPSQLKQHLEQVVASLV
ncbi:MAG: hypothetical protein QG629_726 [Patescibacteria group bacterium]|nr:VWA domain-containing protein [Candidatus Saccharibacteria bacterium]MDQ5963643.1 hypothetical protein [Patescibacteria group bacterium]